MRYLSLLFLSLLFTPIIYSQNIGIGTPAPSEKLEVSGIMYTNDGGVRFPDGTLQTTAAMAFTTNGDAVRKLIGLMKIDGVAGPLDTLGMNRVFPVYHLDQGLGSNPPGPIQFENMMLTTEIVENSAEIMGLVTSSASKNVRIYFLRNSNMGSPEVYLEMGLSNALFTHMNFLLDHFSQGDYTHLINLEISSRYLGVRDKSGVICHCWDQASNASTMCKTCFPTF